MTQTTEKHNLNTNSKALKSQLDGVWYCDSDKVTAIKDIENHKGVKYGEELLQEHTGEEMDLNPSNFKAEEKEMSAADIKTKYIKKLHKLQKMTESNKVRIMSGQNLPVIFVLFKDKEYRGALLVAPRINEEMV